MYLSHVQFHMRIYAEKARLPRRLRRDSSFNIYLNGILVKYLEYQLRPTSIGLSFKQEHHLIRSAHFFALPTLAEIL
jgi:hypothetical protein